MTMSKNILVTGASTGIGNSLCKEFIKRGYRVFGSVRSELDKKKLQSAFGPQFHSLIFDVRNEQQILDSVNEVKKITGTGGLAGLINNAGVAFGGPLVDMSMEEIKFHFDATVFGLLQVTKAYLPLLGATSAQQVSPGRIVNISSTAGKSRIALI